MKYAGDMMDPLYEGISRSMLRDGFRVLDKDHQEYYWAEYCQEDEMGNTRRGERECLVVEMESYPGFLRRAKGDER